MNKRALFALRGSPISEQRSPARSINFTVNIEKNTPPRCVLLRADATRSRYRCAADFKVNTPLKSHQSKIESLTVARGLFYIQSNNGHRRCARRARAHTICKQGWKYDVIPRIAVAGMAYAKGECGEGRRGSVGPGGTEVGAHKSAMVGERIKRISIDTNRVSRDSLSPPAPLAGKIHASRCSGRYRKNNRPIAR